MLERTMAVLVLCAGWGVDVGSAGAQSLFTKPSADVGALPTRKKKDGAPEIQVALSFEALRNETHPGLRSAVLVQDTVVKLVGKGFGAEAGGRSVMLTSSTLSEPLTLTVLSWRDDEIRVLVPSFAALGVDAKFVSNAQAELRRSTRHVVGPQLELALQGTDGSAITKSRHAQLAVAFRDLDNDGHDADDCDDFDGRRTPGRREVDDPDGLDEDCNPDTKGEAALATLDEPTL